MNRVRLVTVSIRRWLLPLTVLLATAVGLAGAQAPAIGALAGQVVDDGGRPLAGATVKISLITKGATFDRTTATNDEGRFEFQGVPAGRFALIASLADYLSAQFGADSPGDPGVPVSVPAGQRLSNVDVTLRRGGAIGGRVTDERGNPCAGHVRALSSDGRAGEMPRIDKVVETGQDGAYRIGDLPGGAYWVVAEPRETLLRVQDASGVQRSVAPSRTFYPAATSKASAASLAVGPGDEVTGIDVRVSMRPATSVEVTVTTATGARTRQVQLALLTADGRMGGVQAYTSGSETPRVDGVIAGQYQVIASAFENSRDRQWATGEAVVDGTRPVSLSLVLQPPAGLEGHVRLDPIAAPNGQGAPMRLVRDSLWASYMRRPGGSSMAAVIPDDRADRRAPSDIAPPVWITSAVPFVPRGVLAFDGVFELFFADATQFGIRFIAPGRYVLQAGDVNAPPGWALKSATIGGRDVLDLPITLHSGDNLTDVALTLTDRFAGLMGAVTGEDGKPRFDVTVTVFPSDSRYWWRGTRRIRTTRPDTAGVYELEDLPAGEYLVAILPLHSAADLNDPDVLARLAASATSVSIADAARNVQDLRVK